MDMRRYGPSLKRLNPNLYLRINPITRQIYIDSITLKGKYTLMGSTRASALIKIMQIEDKIKRLINSKKYKDVQSNIRLLKSRTGRAVFEVQNPEESDKMVEVRRHSKESQDFLVIYENILFDYQVQLKELGEKKKNLTSELFK